MMRPVRGGRDGTTTTTRSSVLPVMELAKVDDSVYGPVLCVVAAAWVGWTFFNGAKETKEIGEELSAKGYDVRRRIKAVRAQVSQENGGRRKRGGHSRGDG